MTPTVTGPVSVGRSLPGGIPGAVLTLPHTVPSGANCLFVMVMWTTFFRDPPNQPVVTWLGTPLRTLHIRAEFSLYQLLSPTPGSGDVVVTGSAAHGTSLGAVAVNIQDYAGIRFGECVPNAWFSADAQQMRISIYAAASDLVLDFAGWIANGLTIAPLAGQTVLASASGAVGSCGMACSQIDTPVNAGVPAVQANLTSAGWDLSAPLTFNTASSYYILAIKGLDDAAPAGAPGAIGRVTDTMTLEQQPPSDGSAVANNYWQWRHEIPTDYRTLVVLVTWFDTGVASVAYTPDGGAPQALTQLVQSNSAGCWILENAPIGTGYIRVVLSTQRWYGASAYSIAGQDVTADVFRGGIDPNYMRIDTTPGNLVVDRVGQLTSAFLQWTPNGGRTPFYSQPIVGSANPHANTTGSNSGSSSYTIAAGNSTDMPWTPSPGAGTFSQSGFTFLGVAPPPPPGREGCPDSLDVLPADGQGCDTQVAPQAI